MFSRLFEERDKTITRLVKLGDCIGRSIRENVFLFSIDGNNNQVTYLSESNKVISGRFEIGTEVTLKNIRVQSAEVFEEGEQFDKFVNEKMGNMIESIHYGEYSAADDSFADMLSLWENRLKLGGIQRRLQESAARLAEVEDIVETAQFKNLEEVSPQLQEFLKENLNQITQVPEIRNAVNLSHAVSKAFNFPKISLDELEEMGSYSLKNGVNDSLYEMICRQELVKKELLESKRNFDVIWASNAAIRNLAGTIFEEDEKVVEALSEAIKEVPYLCLASKKSLCRTFSNCLAQVDGATGITEGDIQQFASRIFEYKKEVKAVFIEAINEKYGVNIQNLQSPASFKSLANTQVVIFEALSRLAPKGSVLKGVLSEMGTTLKSKSGVQCIDINDFILEMFVQAGYEHLLSEGESKEKKVDFQRITKELSDIQSLVSSLQEKISAKDGDKDAAYEGDESMEDDEDGKTKDTGKKKKKGESGKEKADSRESVEDEQLETEEVSFEEVAEKVSDGAEAIEDPTEQEEGAPEEDPEQEAKEQEDIVSDLADLEAIVNDIAMQFDGEGSERDDE
jgi:hypothetical protein